jgi:hypothetical protein
MIHFGIASMHFGGQEIGILQKVTIDISFTVAKLYSGGTLYPVSVKTHTGDISGNAEFADINAATLAKILGGTPTGDALTILNTDYPSTFELITSLETDGVDFSITFPKCRSTKMAMSFARETFLIPNFDFAVEADTDGTVMTIDVGDVS